MSVRTYDPKQAEIFPPGTCSEPLCGKPYHTICRLCNRAFCAYHLMSAADITSAFKKPHACDTHSEFFVLTPDEVLDLFAPTPSEEAPKNGEANHGA